MNYLKKRLSVVVGLSVASLTLTGPLFAADDIEEIIVTGTTPGSGLGLDVNKLPFAVQTASSADLERSQSLDLSEFMNQNLSAVNINSAQNNPLQPDVQFRGFTASPLLGLPQGISVYQNGVRINEPLGDSVNWDLLPESAVSSIGLISGANPMYGLNTLGGAIAIKMKDGFNFSDNQIQIETGSWGRLVSSIESGKEFGDWGYYVNISHFEEDGWRELSESTALNIYGSLSWRNNEVSEFNLNFQKGDSDLRGNGAAPIGLLAIKRDEIFTAPDITENDLTMFSIDGSHYITSTVQFSGSASIRENKTDSFNGDASEFAQCDYFGGSVSLFEDADEIEEALESLLGIELDDICSGTDSSITNFNDLKGYIFGQAEQANLDPEGFELDDIFQELSGSGVISDEGLNNISNRKQQSQGFDGKLTFLDDIFSHENRLTVGYGFLEGKSSFNSILELSKLDPVTRSTAGLGTGAFVDEAATHVKTKTTTWSFYFTDTINITEQLAITMAGRYNDSKIMLRDKSGVHPELNGNHHFTRFNPSLGFAYNINANTNFYGSFSQSSRVPTPIELSCNEGVFAVAQAFAIEAGEDPDDIEFECRLPNAFLADPPLDDVVTRNFELGLRGNINGLTYQLGIFNAVNHDDIIFQTTGRATGLFADVDKTQRLGFESSIKGGLDKFDWYAAYSYIEASFEENFAVLSPNHISANAEGVIFVEEGDRIPGVPKHLLKVGGDYQFNNALSLGIDAIYNSNQIIRGDESNEMDEVDGYAVLNFRVSYNYSDAFTVFSRVTNVLDSKFENFGLLGEEPDEVLPGLADNRPIFLGAGAPRAAWIGLKYRF